MQDKPRLLVLASTYPRWRDDHEPGFVHQLAKRLTNRFEVTVITPHASGAARQEFLDDVRIVRYRYAPAALETLVHDGGIIANLRRSAWKWLLLPTFLLGQMVATWREIRSWRPHIVHAHWLIPQGLVSTLVSGKTPFIVTSHGADLYALNAGPLRVLKRWVLRHAAAATTVSGNMRTLLVALGIEPEKVSVVPMGVDLSVLFTPDASVQRDPNEILFVGRLVPKKGLKNLIDALPAIRLQRPQARITIVGFGPEEAALKVQVSKLGLGECVQFAGAQPQASLASYYRRASIFVAPFVRDEKGDQEGLPVALMEAIGCECPVVVGDVAGIEDILGDGTSHLRVSAGDQQALAKAVIGLLSDIESACRDARKLRGDLIRKLEWSTIADSYAQLLQRCALRPREKK